MELLSFKLCLLSTHQWMQRVQDIFQVRLRLITINVHSVLKNPFVVFRYKGWFDAWQQIWRHEGVRGFFRGATPRVLWFVPASAVSFMAVEWLRKEFNTPTSTVHIDSPSVHIESNDGLSGLSSQSQMDTIAQETEGL